MQLTDREHEVLRGKADGLSTKKIMAKLNQPEETVRADIKSIYEKLGVRYRTPINLKSVLKEFWHRIRKGK